MRRNTEPPTGALHASDFMEPQPVPLRWIFAPPVVLFLGLAAWRSLPWSSSQDSKSLDFGVAASEACEPGRSASDRKSAQFRVYNLMLEGANVLAMNAKESGDLGDDARALLEKLRKKLKD